MSIIQEILPSSFTVTLPLFLLAVGLVTLRWLWPVARMFLVARNIPGPRAYPLIGNILDAPRSPNELFKKLERWQKDHGKVFKMWCGNVMLIFLTDSVDVKHFYGSKKTSINRPSYLTKALSIGLGDSLVTLGDEKWKTHRKIINPMFNYSVLKTFMSVFEENAQTMSKKLAEVADGQTVDMIHYTSSCVIETILETVTGCKIADMQEQEELFIKALFRGEELVIEVILQPWLQIPLLQRFYFARKEVTATVKCLSDFVEHIISKNLEERRKKKVQQASHAARNNDVSGKTAEGGGEMTRANQFSSLLDLMIRESESGNADFTADEINGELVTMITGGFISTSGTLSFLFILLGIHQDIQEEISRELDQVFGSDLRPASVDDLSRLVTLERAIKETLRLFPMVPFSPREIPEDIHLPSGKVLPAGSFAIIYLYHLHRDPDSFYDPESFVPDRWLPENCARINTNGYLPFSSGPRSCIGQKYALLQLKVVASHMLRRFRIATRLRMADLSNLNASVTLQLNSECNVQLYKKGGVK